MHEILTQIANVISLVWMVAPITAILTGIVFETS